MTIIAQDPAVRGSDGEILTAQVEMPAEILSPGPMGHRVHVIDYDASTGTLYRGRPKELDEDPYAKPRNTDRLLRDPKFHQQNVYAIAMRTLARFERALGRRVSWGFPGRGHQIKIVPHAFAEANAFYSRNDESLLFGYFQGVSGDTIFSCLSHDVVAHETTHALLDGLRPRYMYDSSPDQAAFHEGFSDVVALLSVFAISEVVDAAFQKEGRTGSRLIPPRALEREALRTSVLLSLADQMGQELSSVRGAALRQSADLLPGEVDLDSQEFLEPHRRGEVFVAAMMNAFLEVWIQRIEDLDPHGGRGKDRDRVIEEGALAAERLLTMAIRAIDFCPPVDLLFRDFLSAMLTADLDLSPNLGAAGYAEPLKRAFSDYGIEPASKKSPLGDGIWNPAPADLSYTGLHFRSLQEAPDEVFRFVWENRKALQLYDDAYTYVQSVSPCLRMDLDGFVIRETVAECVQVLQLRGRELRRVGLRPPDGMDGSQPVTLYGGISLIFGEFGQLRFNIYNSVESQRQQARLDYLVAEGALGVTRENLSGFHRARSVGPRRDAREEW